MTPRPKKDRNCCGLSQQFRCYKPAKIPLKQCQITTLADDEYTALLLCDGQGLNQQQAGEKMGVSRGTIQRLVSQGRQKLILAVHQGQALIIDAANEGDADSLTAQPGTQ